MDQNDMFGELLFHHSGPGNVDGFILIVRDRGFGYDHPAPAFIALGACLDLPSYPEGFHFGGLVGHGFTVAKLVEASGFEGLPGYRVLCRSV